MLVPVIIIGLILVWLVLHLALRPGPVGSPFVVAHRGDSASAPENTAASVLKAIENGAAHIEIDVQCTSDNVLVLMHDSDVSRTTGGAGNINDMAWAEVARLDAGSHFSAAFKGEKVPLLEDILEIVKENDVTLYIEVKNPVNTPGIDNLLVDLIEKLDVQSNVVVISFDKAWLTEFGKTAPELATGWISLWSSNGSQITTLKSVHLHWLRIILDPTFVKTMHAKGYKVIAWTVDSPLLIKVLLNLGVDGITTNVPVKAITLID